MPIYDYECEKCGVLEDLWARINEQVISCEKCGGKAKRIMSATRSNPDWEPYLDENLVPQHSTEPQVVKSRQHRKELMLNLGLVDRWTGL